MVSTIHLMKWTPERAIAAKDDVLSLLDHPGYLALLEAADLRAGTIQQEMMGGARETAAQYADVVGRMKGLQEIFSLADSILLVGHAAEKKIREEQEEAVAA